MGKQEVGAFLTHLAVEGQVAASTQNQALSALLFLYREVLERDFGWLDDVVRAKKPKRLLLDVVRVRPGRHLGTDHSQRALVAVLAHDDADRVPQRFQVRTIGRIANGAQLPGPGRHDVIHALHGARPCCHRTVACRVGADSSGDRPVGSTPRRFGGPAPAGSRPGG